MTTTNALFNIPNNSASNKRNTLPPGVLQRLDAEGHIDLATGATRRARPARCPKCSTWVIRGLDADWCAQAVDADPEPLTAEGEALARLAGARTYTLALAGGRAELDYRDDWRIRGRPAGTGRHDVLAAHRCQRPDLPRAPSRIPIPTAPADLPDEPPF